MLDWLRKWLAPSPTPAAPQRRREFSTDVKLGPTAAADVHAALRDRLARAAPAPVTPGVTSGMDSAVKLASFTDTGEGIGDVLFSWFGSQGFIGHQMCAVLAQHWLIDKACSMPARDAVRQGFKVTLAGADTDAEHLDAITKANKKFRLNSHLQDYIRMGRVFGIRIAIFKVRNSDPKYYELPFNIDAVAPGTYEGIVQVDPYWCAPELDMNSVGDPASPEFYEPTWWRINGKRYHHSHLAIFRTPGVADILKPAYSYGGVPIPQKIMERVYAAERTANEGPQLAATKRLDVWQTDVAELMGNQEKFLLHMGNMLGMRDNYGVKLADVDDAWQQFDTTLTGLDDVISGQYQIVSAASNVPATKLLGTAPKGFNSTGDYEESSYHEELETIQENDLSPLVERHHELVVRSVVEPDHGIPAGTLHASVEWNPLDSPTAKEEAEANLAKAQADQIYVTVGAIDGADVRERLRADRTSGYGGIEETPGAEAGEELDDAIEELKAAAGMTGTTNPETDLDMAMTALEPHVDHVGHMDRTAAALTDG